ASITFTAGANLIACNLNSGGGDVSLTAGASSSGILSARTILTAGAGNISMQANFTGAGSGIITQTGRAVGQAINISAAGSVTVDAVRGTSVSVTTNNGSISSSAANPIQSSAQLTLSAT